MKPQISFDELEAAIRARVCLTCSERTTDSVCGLGDPSHCSLFSLFPLVVQAILATESDDIDVYYRAIHEHVCSTCIDQRMDGVCPRRGQACALDAHLPQIVEAIEEVTGRQLRRATVAGSKPVVKR